VALAIFPLLAFFPFNWVEFSWGFQHRHVSMPPQVAQKAEMVGRYVLWLRNGLVVVAVLGFAASQSLRRSQIGLVLDGWQRNSLIGIAASLLPLSLQGMFRRRYPVPDTEDNHLAAEPATNWIFSQLLSVLAEELWMAFCIVSLIQTGHSVATAVILPATVFGALHFRYGSKAIGTGITYGAVSACLFLWRGSLLPSYLMHYIRNVGALYFARRGDRSPFSEPK